MIKRLEAIYLGGKRIERLFSDGSHGVFGELLAQQATSPGFSWA